jgi:transposase
MWRPRGGLTTKIHMVAASERVGIKFFLSGGNAHDCPEGKKLIDKFNCLPEQIYMLMDKEYESRSMRSKIAGKGLITVAPPKRTRKEKWDYDKELYKQRNKIENGGQFVLSLLLSS